MTNGNDAAFSRQGFALNAGDYDLGAEGMTKREYFAAMILQGLMANPERYKYIADKMKAALVPGQDESLKGMSQEQASAKNANKAVMLANALIDALNKEQK